MGSGILCIFPLVILCLDLAVLSFSLSLSESHKFGMTCNQNVYQIYITHQFFDPNSQSFPPRHLEYEFNDSEKPPAKVGPHYTVTNIYNISLLKFGGYFPPDCIRHPCRCTSLLEHDTISNSFFRTVLCKKMYMAASQV